MEGNYGWGLPIQASTYAKDIDLGLYVIHAAMILIFVVWSVFFVYLLIRYRRRPGAAADGGHEHEGGVVKSLAPDLAVLAFEILLVVVYALPVWSRVKMTMPSDEEAMKVAVIGEQFAWNVHYPGDDGRFGPRSPERVHFTNPIGLDKEHEDAKDDILLANELHVPMGRPTLIELGSKDVIHSFFVPDFRIKQDAVPGLRQKVWLQPTRAGEYEITCAQLCGFGHSLMTGKVVVHEDEDFEAWLASKKPAAPQTETFEAW